MSQTDRPSFMGTQPVTKNDVYNSARRLMLQLGAKEVNVQHGSWSSYKVATTITFTWHSGAVETMQLTGTKREQLRSLRVALKALSLFQETHYRSELRPASNPEDTRF